MPKIKKRFLWRYVPPLILVVLLGVTYALTMAPGISWANNGADGGDLITAAVTGGVPHPSGYPTYLLLVSAFQRIPAGTLALRTNLFSAVSMLVAALFLYWIVIDIPVEGDHKRSIWLAGVLTALVFGWSELAWSQAVITEVYGLHCLFITLVLFLLLKREKVLPARQKDLLDALLGLAMGLGMGNHLTIIALLPLVLGIGILERKSEPINKTIMSPFDLRNWSFAWRVLFRRLLWLLAGLTVYFLLPLRASSGSPVNWGDASTLDGFIWLVTGRLYTTYIISPPKGFLTDRIINGAGILVRQLGVWGMLLTLYGIIFSRVVPRRYYWATGWLGTLLCVFFIFYHTYDATVYLLPVSLVLSFWFGVGGWRIVNHLQTRRRWLGIGSGALLLVFLATMAFGTASQVDASKDWRAEMFIQEVSDVAPIGALLITSGDPDAFALWYYHFALGKRSDLRIVVPGLMQFGWYRENLRNTYPDLSVPDEREQMWAPVIIAANPGMPVCSVYVETEYIVLCESSTQTP